MNKLVNVCDCAQQNGQTPLHMAAFEGHTAVVESLSSHGALINQPNKVKYVNYKKSDVCMLKEEI